MENLSSLIISTAVDRIEDIKDLFMLFLNIFVMTKNLDRR